MKAEERQAKEAELRQLQSQVAELQRELEASGDGDDGAAHGDWRTEFYTGYYLVTGFALGMFAACTSLLFNVVGSAMVESHPLRLIQVYLTFPLGARALELDGGIALTIGCCLYIATGMLLGAVFHLLLIKAADQKTFQYRFGVATILASGMWFVHFYLILSWLQPALFGGNWIVELIPWWVGLTTHLIFGWTMALLMPIGRYVPYQRQISSA